MRTLTAIICITAFFALQYGKLISYYHCRIITLTATAPCDCVKQLLDVHKDGTTHTTATVKEKTEEIWLFHEQSGYSCQPPLTNSSFETGYIRVLPEIYTASVFQPPRA